MGDDTQKVLKIVIFFHRALVFTAIIAAIAFAIYSTIALTSRVAAEKNPMRGLLQKGIEEAQETIKSAEGAEKTTDP